MIYETMMVALLMSLCGCNLTVSETEIKGNSAPVTEEQTQTQTPKTDVAPVLTIPSHLIPPL